MTRPLRLAYPGALYHVTTRGNARQAIYTDDQDRSTFLAVLAAVVTRSQWLCHAYCLMNNHYHLLIETPQGNLSAGMRQLNGIYTQRFKRFGSPNPRATAWTPATFGRTVPRRCRNPGWRAARRH